MSVDERGTLEWLSVQAVADFRPVRCIGGRLRLASKRRRPQNSTAPIAVALVIISLVARCFGGRPSVTYLSIARKRDAFSMLLGIFHSASRLRRLIPRKYNDHWISDTMRSQASGWDTILRSCFSRCFLGISDRRGNPRANRRAQF